MRLKSIFAPTTGVPTTEERDLRDGWSVVRFEAAVAAAESLVVCKALPRARARVCARARRRRGNIVVSFSIAASTRAGIASQACDQATNPPV